MGPTMQRTKSLKSQDFAFWCFAMALFAVLITGCAHGGGGSGSVSVFGKTSGAVLPRHPSSSESGNGTGNETRNETAVQAAEPDLARAFAKSRELIRLTQEKREARKNAEKPAKIPVVRGIVESEAVDFMQAKPKSLSESLEALYGELSAQPPSSDPTKHVRLIPPTGRPGYSDLQFFVSHDYRLGTRRVRSSNLVQVWREFLRSAEKELILNVYEFDLEDVAHDLISAVGRGVEVTVGIDQDVIVAKANIQATHDKLVSGGVRVVAVDSVGINHQKMAAIDWTNPEKARALFSSGNLTQSCLGPEGDLKDLSPRPRESVPNANHVLTMKSWLAANLIYHELSKTFSPELALRGSSYPTSGSYQITGPDTDPYTLEAYPEGSFLISFTPGGSYRGVNRNLLAHIIEKSEGPVRLVQFAYSAQAVSDALLARAIRDYQATGKFDFLSVGDTPFAMQGWSQFLKMSGLKRENETLHLVGPRGGNIQRKISRFLEDSENPWKKQLTPTQLRRLRRQVRIAPKIYGNSVVSWKGKKYDVSAKIHHKLMSVGDFAVVGTSFNFSEGAETNNEQVLVFKDAKVAKIVDGIAQSLAKESGGSVYEEALRRNARNASGKPGELDSENDNATDIGGAGDAVP